MNAKTITPIKYFLFFLPCIFLYIVFSPSLVSHLISTRDWWKRGTCAEIQLYWHAGDTQRERETVPLWNATQQSTISSPVNKRRDYSLLDHVWKTHDKKVHRFACHNWERGIIYYPFGTDSFEYLMRFLHDAWKRQRERMWGGTVWRRRSINPWMRCCEKRLRHHLMKRSLRNCYKFLFSKIDFAFKVFPQHDYYISYYISI